MGLFDRSGRKPAARRVRNLEGRLWPQDVDWASPPDRGDDFGKFECEVYDDGSVQMHLFLRRVPNEFRGQTATARYADDVLVTAQVDAKGRASVRTNSAEGAYAPPLEVGDEVSVHVGSEPLAWAVLDVD